MSNRNISQPVIWSIDKFIRHVMNHFEKVDTNKWVNGRPVLINGDVWCLICEKWHPNNSLCQQP